MQLRNKIITALVGFAGLGLISSCTKFTKVSLTNEGTIYMPQAVNDRNITTLYYIDSVQDIVFGADYGGLNYPSSDIPVTFKLETDLITQYNNENGTSYVPFPDSVYTISGLTSTIHAGTTSSDPLWMAVYAKKLTKGVKYMMPIVLQYGSYSKIDSGKTIAYFRVDSIYTRKRDITANGTLSVSDENSGGIGAGESSVHLVDGDVNTKYLNSKGSDFWYQLQFATAQVVNEYTMTSANDTQSRDPKDWELLGSDDGTNWDTLDVERSQTFAARFQTNIYQIPNLKAYTYYRVHVTSNAGNSLFQQAEWRLVQYY